MKKAVEHYYEKGDLVIIISSSGTSKNIINAAKYCNKNKIKIISFSGMKKNNKLNPINQKGISFGLILQHIIILSSLTFICYFQ